MVRSSLSLGLLTRLASGRRGAPMRIAHVFKDAFPPVAAGITRYMADMAAESVARGCQVDVYVGGVSHTRSETRSDGVTIHRFRETARALSMPLSVPLVRAVASIDADVIHVHSPNPIGELGAVANGRVGGVVVSFHAQLGKQSFLGPLYAPLQRALLDKSCRVLAASQMLADSHDLEPARGKIEFAPYGVSPRMLAPAPSTERSPSGSLRLLFVGRLVYYKGIEVLLDAVARVADVELSIYGDGPLRATVEDRISSDPLLEGRAVLVTDSDDARLVEAHAQHDVVVLPSVSRAEAFGLSMAEAMANGLPAISTSLGTGTDWVNRAGETGLVVSPGDPADLADAIEQIKDDGLRARLANGAIDRARTRFDFSHHADLVHHVYEQAVA